MKESKSMVDPNNITQFSQSRAQLEETLLFWILASGKTAKTASKNLRKLLSEIYAETKISSPFQSIRHWYQKGNCLATLMKTCGIGCYNNKSKTFLQLAYSNIDLFQCEPSELEAIYGIGMKTSRCFIIHSRKDAKYAGLDTHVLKFLKDLNYDVPKSTPASKKKYESIEKTFIKISDRLNVSPGKLDLIIWRVYSQHQHLKSILLKICS